MRGGEDKKASGQKVDCSNIVRSYAGEVAGIDDCAIGRQSNYVANSCRALLRLLARWRVVRAGYVHGPRCAVARAQQPSTEGIDLGEHRGLPSQRLPCDRDRL